MKKVMVLILTLLMVSCSSRADYPESRVSPAVSVFREIPGGNHARFGSYGVQKKDNPARIEEEEQQLMTARFIADFVNQPR